MEDWSASDRSGQTYCKICLGPSLDNKPLMRGLCGCKGSMDFVHGRCDFILLQRLSTVVFAKLINIPSACRCLVKWQKMRLTRPWQCEICDQNISWPPEDTSVLIELLAQCELEMRRNSPKSTEQPQISQWDRLKLTLTRCMIACTLCFASRPARRGPRGHTLDLPQPAL